MEFSFVKFIIVRAGGKQIFRSIVHPVRIKTRSMFVTNMTIYDMTCRDK